MNLWEFVFVSQFLLHHSKLSLLTCLKREFNFAVKHSLFFNSLWKAKYCSRLARNVSRTDENYYFTSEQKQKKIFEQERGDSSSHVGVFYIPSHHHKFRENVIVEFWEFSILFPFKCLVISSHLAALVWIRVLQFSSFFFLFKDHVMFVS